MIAGGIDLGGTKIEAQVFDGEWAVVARHRVDTPKIYAALIGAIAQLVGWIEATAGQVPVGIAAAGLINPETGLALTANLPASGKPFPSDINAAAGRHVVYLNDCHAMILSEAVFGAAKGFNPAVGVILGTGIGGGVVVDGALLTRATGLGGEFGHFPLAAGPVAEHGLPVIRCACGRVGCTETLLSGPGLSRIVQHIAGQTLTSVQIAEMRQKDPVIAKCWNIWCDLLAEMIMTLCLTIDPAVVVLGGGLSTAPDLVADVTAALARAQLAGFPTPVIRLAQGGDVSGARGAAYAALQFAASHG